MPSALASQRIFQKKEGNSTPMVKSSPHLIEYSKNKTKLLPCFFNIRVQEDMIEIIIVTITIIIITILLQLFLIQEKNNKSFRRAQRRV